MAFHMAKVKSFSGLLKKVLLLGLPLLFGQLTQYFHQIADSAMLGHFGETSSELAAIGIAGLYSWMLATFIWPVSTGIQAIASRRYGKQDSGVEAHRFSTGEALDNGLAVTFYAAGLSTLFSFLAKPVLGALLDSREILDLSLQYIRIIRFSLLPLGLCFSLQGFFGALNKTRYVMYAGVLSNLSNILLNWIFIFGKLGLPAMGIRGAALGTVLSDVITLIFLIWIVIQKGYLKQYRLFHFSDLSVMIQKDIIKVAVPPGLQNVFALGFFMTYQTIIEDYSVLYLAATHSTFAFFRLNKSIISGFARSASILAGNALGRGDKEDAQVIITAAGFISGLVAIFISLITFSGRNVIASVFTDSPETASAIVQTLLFFLPFFFIESLGYAFEMVFVPNGYGKWVLFSEFTTNAVFILGATLVVRHLFPGEIRLAWLCFGLYQLFHASLMITGYVRRKWLDIELDRTTGGS